MPRTPPPGWTLPPSFNLQNAPYTPGYQAPAKPAPSAPPFNPQSYAGGAPAPRYSAPAAVAPALPPPQTGAPQQTWPNPGDWDETGGYRWEPTTGQYLPPNFFSDLGGGGGASTGSAGGGYEMPAPTVFQPDFAQAVAQAVAQAMAALQPTAAASAPAIPSRPAPPLNLPLPMTTPFLEFSDQTLGYAPEPVRSYVPSYLQGLGFKGVGNIGQYGERTYQRPTADPFAFNEANFASIADSRMRGWLRYFLGGGQLPTG